MIEKLHLKEIYINYFLQKFDNVYFSKFIEFLNYFDTWVFPVFLMLFIWILIDWKWGFRIYLYVIINALVNHLLKQLFSFPRPIIIDPSIAKLSFHGYSFPSGGAQASIIYAALLLKACRKNLFSKIFAVIYVLLIGFSRIYLGAHFLSDVLFGFLAGFIVAKMLLKYDSKVTSFIKESSLKTLSMHAIFLIIIAYIIYYNSNTFLPMSTIFVFFGLILAKRFNALLRSNKKVSKATLSIIIIRLVYFLISFQILKIAYFILAMASISVKSYILGLILMGAAFGIIGLWVPFLYGFFWNKLFEPILKKFKFFNLKD